MIKVSVIVPVYNVEEYLPKCLDTLVNQTLKEIEIIVVNDGSPDNSQQIIEKYAKKFKTIKAYTKENGGLSDARNYGLTKASGKYISFIDSDDFTDIEMLEKMYNKAIKEDLDIVVCDCYKVYPGQDKRELLKSNTNYSEENIKNYLLAPPMAWNRLYKKELFDKIKFTKGIYYEDLECTPKMVKYTNKIGFLEEPLYFYLQRDGSIMKQKEFNNKLLDIFKVLDSNKKELNKKFPKEIEYMYITHLLRTATLRFLDYSNYKENIKKIRSIIKENFPNWKQNKYYKKSSNKMKIICNLAYNNQILLLKIIKKVTNK